MTAREVAEDFTALCKAGSFEEAGRRYWAEDVVSIEAMDGAPVARGRAAVEAKSTWWYANHEVHGVEVEGPFLNGDAFVLRFAMSFTPRATGQRTAMTEAALYTVRDGRVVEERFFY